MRLRNLARSGRRVVAPALTFMLAAGATVAAPVDDDFQLRRMSPGVVASIGFDTAAEVQDGVHPDGEFEASGSGHDTGVKASGNGALRFTVPQRSGSNTSGSWKLNFRDGANRTFGAGKEFYIQWRQRFDDNFVRTKYTSSGGWKQFIVGEADRAGMSEASSCTELEISIQNVDFRGYTQMYHACGVYEGFYEPFGSTDFKMQNAMPSPYCLFSDNSGSGCFKYVANEWMTFQIHVKLGPRGTAYSSLEREQVTGFTNSTIRMWVAREGKPSQLVHNWTGVVLRESDGAEYGKLWLLPYQTDKDPNATHPIAHTWYDEVIVSTQRIPDPAVGAVKPQPPTAVTAQ